MEGERNVVAVVVVAVVVDKEAAGSFIEREAKK